MRKEHSASHARWLAITTLLCLLLRSQAWAQSSTSPTTADVDAWQVPLSKNLMPHFEEVNGRKMLFVDGRPFTVLAIEIPWWDLIYGRYKETETAYDNLYPAAAKLGLNALKVPVKWSMVESKKGIYDFSYVDHAKKMAEQNHLKLTELVRALRKR